MVARITLLFASKSAEVSLFIIVSENFMLKVCQKASDGRAPTHTEELIALPNP